jgi:hypothetical protein
MYDTPTSTEIDLNNWAKGTSDISTFSMDEYIVRLADKIRMKPSYKKPLESHLPDTESFRANHYYETNEITKKNNWEVDPEVEKIFNELAYKCYQQTKHSSFHKDVITNKYYKQIIGIEGVTPILFREFKEDPFYWYDALATKTRHEIDSTEGMTQKEFVDKWIEWGKEKGFIK